jgi:hypothetical protein
MDLQYLDKNIDISCKLFTKSKKPGLKLLNGDEDAC